MSAVFLEVLALKARLGLRGDRVLKECLVYKECPAPRACRAIKACRESTD